MRATHLKRCSLVRTLQASSIRGLLFIGIAASLSLTACSAGPAAIATDLGKETSLALGQKVSINGEPLEIKFAEVISDSRCPTGATCIWQGEASCRLEVLYKNTSNTLIVTEQGLSSEPATTNFSEYQLKYDLSPYPQVSKQIDKNSYRLILTISRTTSG